MDRSVVAAGTPNVASLSDVLPAVAGALGVRAGASALGLPQAERVVVVLVDGLGERLLAQASGHAPFLNSLRSGVPLVSGFPSTTATSMGSFGTGLPPGSHGLVGYEVLDPASGRVFNELSWEGGPDPERWQPNRTVLQEVSSAGVDTFHVGPGYFDGSGLTRAALRGPRFLPAHSLEDRVDATVAAIRGSSRALVYLYWGEVDRVGHERGVDSTFWRDEVEAVDHALRSMIRRLPAGTLVVVTADHGMLDVPMANRLDLADGSALARELTSGVRAFGGEPRTPMLYAEPGQAPLVAERWRRVLGPDAEVLLREDAVAQGWFGAVAEQVLPRIGDVVVAMTAPRAIFDSRTQRRQLLQLIGLHGSRTDCEMAIPLLVHVV